VLQVKQKFYEAFKGDGYPEAFPYRQRVIILFQKIDGVDVALYCMYVQEYGSDCPAPNRNVVYLSYIDRYEHCWITPWTSSCRCVLTACTMKNASIQRACWMT